MRVPGQPCAAAGEPVISDPPVDGSSPVPPRMGAILNRAPLPRQHLACGNHPILIVAVVPPVIAVPVGLGHHEALGAAPPAQAAEIVQSPGKRKGPTDRPPGPLQIGRSGGIRTHDPFTPSEVRYQAALRSGPSGRFILCTIAVGNIYLCHSNAVKLSAERSARQRLLAGCTLSKRGSGGKLAVGKLS